MDEMEFEENFNSKMKNGAGLQIETIDGRTDMTNIEMGLIDTRMIHEEEQAPCKNSLIRPSCVPISIILSFVILIVMFPMLEMPEETLYNLHEPCRDPCTLFFVESIPENLTFPKGSPKHLSTYEAWTRLLQIAEKNVDLTAFYWSLKGSDVFVDPSDWQGEAIFRKIRRTGNKGIKIRIAQNSGDPNQTKESTDLKNLGLAEVRNLNMSKWFGGGVLHTKLWIVDEKHFYLGSANMDWRSLTQVKELGVAVFNCSCMAKDLQKIFEVYWYMGDPDRELPKKWSPDYFTRYNSTDPLPVTINGSLVEAYFSSSPPGFCPNGRQSDLQTILSVIRSAKKFIHIAVMDYVPATLYSPSKKYWPVIDDALRRSGYERGVSVKLLISLWNHTRSDIKYFLKSLSALNGVFLNKGATIEIKWFQVPAFTPEQAKIPFARVNHNKYMVTDNTAYIGTSNWSGDYFTTTAGIALVLRSTLSPEWAFYHNVSMDTFAISQLQDIFMRDWNSPFAKSVDML